MKHGLIGKHRFSGKQGVLDLFKEIRCIQFDPIDSCSKSPELSLFSKVEHFNKQMLYDLLYKDHELVDHFDKNLSIYLKEDWPYFSRVRENFRNNYRSKEEIETNSKIVLEKIKEKGPCCSKDIEMNDKVDWYWSSTNLSRAILEQLYFTGELMIHHKKGSFKYYDLTERYLELKENYDPFTNDFEYLKYRALRRIQSVGLLWNKASDAWLGIPNFKTAQRNEVFKQLLIEGKIIELNVEGLNEKLYCTSTDQWLLNEVLNDPQLEKRCEFIAPLENMMWDRKLIKELFGFEYKWEIYTPDIDRKYGYYVLPILYGDQFIGRIEPIYDRKNKKLTVKNIWYEEGIKPTKKMESIIKKQINKLEKLNQKEIISLK